MKILAILALVMPAAAIAQVQTAATTVPPAPPRSSEERICRNSGEIGSRLNRTRVCRSRQQWEDMRRDQRNTIDRAQRQFNPTVDEAISGN